MIPNGLCARPGIWQNRPVGDGPASLFLPPPPARLKEPNVEQVAAGTLLQRVHARQFAGNAFNPCKGSATRFAPIRDRDGACIPSLYASSTVVAAVYETVFHDVPVALTRKTVPVSQITKRMHSTLRLRRSITLASLRAPDLRKWSLDRDSLLACMPAAYQRTALWAKAIHDRFAEMEGLIWTSVQCDPDDALLLFGDRVAPADIEVVSVRDGGVDGSLWKDVRDAGLRGGIRLTL